MSLGEMPMRESGMTAMCRSVDNGVLGQGRSAGGTTGKAHLFFDCPAKILDQMKPIDYMLGLRCALTTACAYRPQRSRLTTSTEG